MSNRARAGWGLFLILSLLMSLLAARYFSLDPEVYFPDQRSVYEDNTIPLIGHVAGAIVATLLAPVQLLPGVRRRRPAVHRVLGRGYAAGVVIGGLFGFWLAFLAFGGAVATAGFAVLAVLWVLTVGLAVTAIRGHDVAAHRRWMLRNVALTFAAVTLRLWLPTLEAIGLDFADAYRTVAWLAWVPNLVVMEWWLGRDAQRAGSSDRRMALAAASRSTNRPSTAP